VVDPFWDSYLWLDYYGYEVPNEYGSVPAGAPQPNTYVPPAPSYWYYCPDSKTFYPYVRQCASEWQAVTPSPAR